MPASRIVIRRPQRARSIHRLVLATIGAALSGLFLLNLSFGLIEIPDNLPFVGNLDEVVVSGLFYGCLSYLGVDLIPFRRQKKPKGS